MTQTGAQGEAPTLGCDTLAGALDYRFTSLKETLFQNLSSREKFIRDSAQPHVKRFKFGFLSRPPKMIFYNLTEMDFRNFDFFRVWEGFFIKN